MYFSLFALLFTVFAATNAGLLAPAYYSAPISTYTSGYVPSPYVAPLHTQAVASAASEDTVIAGPSGTISTSRNVAGPSVSTRYSAPVYTPVYTRSIYPGIPYAYTNYGGFYL